MTKVIKKENEVFPIELNKIELLFCMQAISWALGEIMPEKLQSNIEANGHCTTLIMLNQKLSKHLDTLIEEIQSE